jgi:hypothetical protein
VQPRASRRNRQFDAEPETLDGRTVEVLEEEFRETRFVYGEVKVCRKAAFVSQAKLAQRGAPLENEPKIEQARDVQVVQCVILRDVDQRAIAEHALSLAVAEEQAFRYHAFALGTSSESTRL